jgi:hypothetical protein
MSSPLFRARPWRSRRTSIFARPRPVHRVHRKALRPTGVMNASLSKGEQALMIKSGADKAPPDIRRKVDEESSAIVEADNGFTEKLIFWRSAPIPGDPVDAQGEANRLKANASLGKPATAGDTVIIDRKSSGFLSDIF